MIIVRILSIVITALSFFYYILGLMHLSPLLISGLIFFICLLVTIRLLTPSGKKQDHPTNI